MESCVHRARVGEEFRGLGVLVTVQDASEAVRGLRVRVGGDAAARGIVVARRAAARPWSARLAPWQRCSWECDLAGDGAWRSCVLPGVWVGACGPPIESPIEECAPAHVSRAVASRRVMRGLRAVWIDVACVALAPGDGSLSIEVLANGPHVQGLAESTRVHVSSGGDELCSAYWRLRGPRDESRAAITQVLDAFAATVASRSTGESVWAVEAAHSGHVGSRVAFATCARDGLRGDRRCVAHVNALAASRVTRLRLRPATPPTRSAETLQLEIAASPRWTIPRVEVCVSFGTESLRHGTDGSVFDTASEFVHRAGPDDARIVAHPWTGSPLAWCRAAVSDTG